MSPRFSGSHFSGAVVLISISHETVMRYISANFGQSIFACQTSYSLLLKAQNPPTIPAKRPG